MGVARRDNRLAARALAEWALTSFNADDSESIASRFKVTARTLRNWRAAIEDDPELARIYRERLASMLDRHWAADLESALAETIARLRELVRATDYLGAVTSAFDKLSEVAITREVLGVSGRSERALN